MNKKIITTIIVLVCVGAAAAAYVLFFSPAKFPAQNKQTGNLPNIGGRTPVGQETQPESGQQNTSGQAVASERPVLQIINKEIFAPAIAADGKSLLYLSRDNGHVLSSDLDGSNERSVTNLTVLNVFDGAWPAKRDRVLLRYAENDIVKSFTEGIATGTVSRFLSASTQSADWSPDGRSIAYLVGRSSDTALTIADAGSKNPRIVYTTPVPDFTVHWVSSDTILLVSRPSGLAPSIVLRFTVSSGQANILMGGVPGLVIAPAPNGTGFLFSRSAANGGMGQLALYTFKTKQTFPFNVTTIAEKCVFSPDSKRAFCGMPKGTPIPPEPDSWYMGAASFSDTIVEIDLASGNTTTLLDKTADVDAINLFVSPDGKYLFFMDKKTSTLWRMQLGNSG